MKSLDCEIVVSEFTLKSRYYVNFGINTIGKGMKLLIPSDGLNGTTTVLLEGWL